MTCPAPGHRRAVVLYGLDMLENDMLSDAIRQELIHSLAVVCMTVGPMTAGRLPGHG